MAAVSVNNPFGALSLSSYVMGASETESQLVSGKVVAAYQDTNGAGRICNPYLLGFLPTTGDAAAKWLPTVTSVTAVTDPSGTVGSYTIVLTPGTSDNVSVVATGPTILIKVSPGALFTVATGTF
jgi:hypothetical protein